jgi:hypothetical protein
VEDPLEDDATANDSVIKFSIRLSWGLVGPLTLFFVGAYILREARPPASFASLLYFGVVLLTLVLRLFDIEILRGTTLGGRPATLRDWKSYAMMTALIATLGWCGIQYAISSKSAQESEKAPPDPDPAW